VLARRRAEGLAVVLVGLVVLTVAIYFPFLVALLWGAVLVTATYPIHRKLLERLGGRKSLAAALSTAAVVVCLLLPFAAIAPQFIAETRAFANEGLKEVRKAKKDLEQSSNTIINTIFCGGGADNQKQSEPDEW